MEIKSRSVNGAENDSGSSIPLSLEYKWIYIYSDVIQDILSGCPLIENLDIDNCNVEDIDVSSLHNLVVLHIRETYSRSINVSFASLTKAEINEFPRLRTVWLTGVEMDGAFFKNFSSSFPCIEELILDKCTGYEEIQISSKSLKFFTLHLKENLEKAKFDVPNIRKFKFRSRNSDIPALSFCTVSREWESEVKLSGWNSLKGPWFVGLREFLKELTVSKIYLHLKLCQNRPIGAKNLLHSPPIVVEHLVLNYHPQLESFLYALFGFCHPMVIELSKIRWKTEVYGFAQVLHGLLQHQNANWFTRIHELVEIDVEIFQDSEWEIIPLKTFVEDCPVFSVEDYIQFRFEWGAFKCT